MTQDEKELLLKDLSARLPYGLICQFIWTYSNETTPAEGAIAVHDDNIRCIDIHTKDIRADYYDEWVDLEHCKPYLRPMYSMTEEERNEFENLFPSYSISEKRGSVYHSFRGDLNLDIIDWLNAHHLDFRGLIPMGLALEAPEEMYNIKEK